MNGHRVAWEPPSELDGFHVIRLLGAGAMGRVYLAREVSLERDVALKFIAAERPEARAVERFMLEARAIARLQHPNVVAIYRIGEVDGRPYLAYELIRGRSLDEVSRPLPWREVLPIAVGLARGLAAAHARGILHRDIKPANVMLSETGEVKLVDFGIAKLVDPDAGPLASPSAAEPGSAPIDSAATQTDAISPLASRPRDDADRALTQAGIVIGTPRYLAPERWSGQPATPRSEVFSMGLVLYELLTGAVGERSRHDPTGRAHEAPLPPVKSLAPDAPTELADVVDRAVRVDPLARWAHPEEMREVIERVAELLAAARVAPAAPLPSTRYTRNGPVSVAYQVYGDGPIDLVLVPGFVSHVELSWDEPSSRAFHERLAGSARLILFDKRGTGLSDRVDVSSLEDRVEDMRAVMDAAGSERAVIFGQSEGGTLALVFAARFPERVRGLVLYGTSARTLASADYPEGMDPAIFEWAYAEIEARWGGPVFLEQEAPSRLHDRAFVEWWARFLKMGASPGAAIALLRSNSQIDVRHLLAGIDCPTLVVNRRGDPLMRWQAGRYLSEHLPDARFVLLEGADHLPFVGDSDAVLAAIEAFLRQLTP